MDEETWLFASNMGMIGSIQLVSGDRFTLLDKLNEHLRIEDKLIAANPGYVVLGHTLDGTTLKHTFESLSSADKQQIAEQFSVPANSLADLFDSLRIL